MKVPVPPAELIVSWVTELCTESMTRNSYLKTLNMKMSLGRGHSS